MQILKFDWSSFSTHPPQWCRVVRANDHVLLLKRERNNFVENIACAKIGASDYAVFRAAVSLGEARDNLLLEQYMIYHGSLNQCLAIMGYRVQQALDKKTG